MSLREVRDLLASPENRGSFLERTRQLFPKSEKRIFHAYDIAKFAFRERFRANGEDRYFEHLRFVALILIDILHIRDVDMIIAALLHDIVEDTQWSIDQVRDEFGDNVANLVWWLTKPDALSGQSPNERDQEYRKRFRFAPHIAVVIKLADRLHNLCTLWDVGKAQRDRKIRETQEFYLPLAIEHAVLSEEIGDILLELEKQIKLEKQNEPATA